MKKLLIILMIVLISQIVFGDVNIKGGEKFLVNNFEKCYGNVKIKVEQTEGVLLNYKLLECDSIDTEIWLCPCEGNKTNITFQPNMDDANTYDFIMEYYIGPQPNETNKRIKEVNNIKVITVKKKEPLAFPALDGPGPFIIIGILISFLIVGLVFLFRYIMSEDDTTSIPIKKESKQIKDEKIDEELNNIINNYR